MSGTLLRKMALYVISSSQENVHFEYNTCHAISGLGVKIFVPLGRVHGVSFSSKILLMNIGVRFI